MIFSKKRPIIVAMLSVIVILAFAAEPFEKNTIISAEKTNNPQIIIDAGHGGFDGGAVAGDGTVEKDINLNIALVLKEMLSVGGYDVIMTRQTDVSTDDVETDKIASRKKSDLKNRLELMNTYPDAVFVSIHLNKFTTSSASGSQVFYNGRTAGSDKLAEKIRASIIGLLQPKNTRVNKQATSSTYLLYNATVPAVLVECGFLSNKSDLELLKTEQYQNKIAFSIYCGINEYFLDNKEI